MFLSYLIEISLPQLLLEATAPEFQRCILRDFFMGFPARAAAVKRTGQRGLRMGCPGQAALRLRCWQDCGCSAIAIAALPGGRGAHPPAPPGHAAHAASSWASSRVSHWVSPCCHRRCTDFRSEAGEGASPWRCPPRLPSRNQAPPAPGAQGAHRDLPAGSPEGRQAQGPAVTAQGPTR